MFSTFINAFKIKDLRKKILYTVLLIVVYRLGSAIPIPGRITLRIPRLRPQASA